MPKGRIKTKIEEVIAVKDDTALVPVLQFN